MLLAKSNVIDAENIFLRKSQQLNNDLPLKADPSLKELEKMYIKKVLDDSDWNKKVASKRLGISKTTLYSKIEKYQLQKD